jgi:signal transduction histidine kinase
MVEQIDHLSKIASEFSQFANIDQAKKVNMDLNESFRSLKQLYSSNPDQDFIWDLEPGPVYIFADPTHINRLFTNLIQNAIQAAVDDVRPEVRITEKVEDGMVTIRLSDNGEGIAEAIQSRIFTPNFTTKTSGTGLGLAMCKRMVEQSNGEIWFETSKGSGTTFYVTFPITLR